FDWLDRTILQSTRNVVVDGYPREPSALPQFNALTALLQNTQIIAFHLECSKALSFSRLAARRRPDDTPELAAARYSEYEAMQRPLLHHMPAAVRLVQLDASDPNLLACATAIVSETLLANMSWTSSTS